MGFRENQQSEKEKFDYKDKKDYVPYQNKVLRQAEPDTWYEECFEGVLVETLEQLEELCNVSGSIVALDTETTGLTFFKDKIVGISFSFSSKDGYYVPLRHQYGNLPLKESLECIKRLLYNNKILMFNVIFDSMMLTAEGIDMTSVDLFEIQSLVFCADSNVKGRNLKWASEWYLGRKSPTFKQTLGTSDENFHFGYLLPYESVLYTCSDSSNTFGLYEVLYKPLMDECSFIIKLDNALVKAMLNYYVRQPIYIDSKKMYDLSEYIRNRILELERKIFLKLGTTVDLECVDYDGFVDTQEYGSINMYSLKNIFMVDKKVHVKTPTGYNLVTDFIDVGMKPLVEVELVNGSVLKCSPNEYFLVKNNSNEIYFKQIKDVDLELEELYSSEDDVLSELELSDCLLNLLLCELNPLYQSFQDIVAS